MPTLEVAVMKKLKNNYRKKRPQVKTYQVGTQADPEPTEQRSK